MNGYSALVLVQDVFCYGDADAVGELAALCVKGKPESVAPRLYAHAQERIKKLSEMGVSVVTMQHTDVVHTELKRISFTVSYLITPFYQKCIYEWE